MRCSKCGAEIEEGKLYCSVCGAEVQLVPEYDTLGNYMRQKEQQKAQEEEAAKRQEEILRRKQQQEEAERKKRTRKSLLIGICLLAICIGALLIFKWYMDHKNFNSYEFQMNKAETAFSNHKFEEAEEYIERAVELAGSDNQDARILQAQILTGQGENEEAAAILEELLEEDPENSTCFGLLLRLYEAEGESEKIKEMLDNCDSQDLLDKYSSYISPEAIYGLPEGTYDEPKTLELYAASNKDKIYYTTDGSDPTEKSTLYQEGIALEEGTTTVKTVVINDRGIASDIASKTYTIQLDPPDPPDISPSSGTFTSDMKTKIYVIVPEGCKAYYAFDEEPTTDSTPYTGPVDMLDGEHTFYAIVVDEYGKVSTPGSQTYVLK